METRDKQRLLYRIIGPEKYERTLLGLHGGPGFGHDYLLPLADIATPENALRVVLYDQLGGGKSERARDKSLYNLQSFREHVEDLRQELDLGTVSLLGHSTGGCIAIEYVLKYPQNVEKLLICGTSANIPEDVRHMQRLKKQLPPDVLAVIEKYERLEDYDNPEYQRAIEVMYKRHVCRKDPLPECFRKAFSEVSKEVYEAFWGPNEFICTGNMRDWNMMDRISEIKVPTLIEVGRYDEVSISSAQSMKNLIPNSQLLILENSSHDVLLEDERDKFIHAVRDFILSR
jgi:proline iminopeptidase